NIRSPLLLRKETEKPIRGDREEDRGLLKRHEHPRELLVLDRGQAPDAVMCLHVEVVDRARHERQHEADRAREGERCKDVASTRARAEAMRPGPGARPTNG